MKSCKNENCDQQNPQQLHNFCKDKLRKDGLNRWCKFCMHRYDKEYRKKAENKEHKKKTKRIFDLKNYGLTLEDYNLTLVGQHYCCKICGIHKDNAGKLGLVIDHCHKTKRFRSLLCSACNTMIGSAKENIEILDKAKSYLNMWNV